MKTFKLGDTVQWCSQSQSYAYDKKGVIVLVIPAGKPLSAVLSQLDLTMYNMETLGSMRFVGRKRDHENYLVAVEGSLKGSTRRLKLYRPYVTLLARVKG